MAIEKIKILGAVLELQSNLAIRNFLVTLKLFLNAKSSLSLWSKWQIGHRKWFLNTNLFLNAKFDCSSKTAPRILIFSIAMGANYSFDLISIVHRVPQFIGHNKTFLSSVKMPFTTLKMQKETYTETEKRVYNVTWGFSHSIKGAWEQKAFSAAYLVTILKTLIDNGNYTIL